MTRNYLLLFLLCWHFVSFANNECSNATSLTPGTSCSFTTGTFSGSTMTGSGPSCTPGATQDVWYKFTATDVTMSVGLNGTSNLNHGFEIYQGGCADTAVACVNAYSAGWGENYFNNNFVVGQEYHVRVFNAGSVTSSTFQICVTRYPTPANDLCANAQQLTPNTLCTLVAGSFSGTLKDGGIPSCAPNASQDLWYKFTATDVTMSVGLTQVMDLNSGFEIYQGGCNGTMVACVNQYTAGWGENYFNNNFVVGQEYHIRVFNAESALQIRNFQICVTRYPTPANDLCANAQQLTPNTSCTLVAGSFSGTLMDGGIPSCAPNASQDLWYKFTATDVTMSVGLTQVMDLNSGFEIYQGGCNGTLVACVNQYTAGWGENYFNNNFVVGQEYHIRVFNAESALQIRNFQICVTRYPTPANDLCANAQQLTPNTSCTLVAGSFSGTLMDGGIPSCAPNASHDLWYKFTATDVTMSVGLTQVMDLNSGFEIYQGGCNGTLVACVNQYTAGWGENYFNNNFVVGQEYHIRVFNAESALQIRNFQICVTRYPTPANDLCANAQQLTPGTSCTLVAGSFSGTLKDGGIPSCAPNASQDLWYKFTATDVTMSVGLTQVMDLNSGFEIYQGGCNGTLVACVNQYTAGWGENYFNNNFVVGQEYHIRVFNAESALQTRNFQICVIRYPTPANDLCANAQQLTPGTSCTLVAGSFSGTLKDGGIPSCAPNASQDLWYKFTATDVTMSIGLTQVMDLNSGFEIYQGGCNGTLVACVNQYTSGWGENYFNNNFVVGQEYHIRVFNAESALQIRNFQICVTRYPTPANDLCANATQLTPANACNYVTGTFSGSLMDGGIPACATTASQDVWYKFTATATTMSINLNQVMDLNHGFEVYQAGCNGTVVACVNAYASGWGEGNTYTNYIVGQEYYVRVINASSALQTRNFGICLQGPPPASCTPSVAITATATTACQGESITFTAAPINGGTAPSYQWKVGTVNVGTNSPTYTTASLTNGNVVTVVMVSNAACASPTSVTSNAVTMNVTTSATPVFTQVAAICPGGTFTLPATSNNGVTGTWSPAVNNNATTTYTFTPNAGQCASTTTMTVAVNNNVIPSFTQIAAICPGGSFTLPAVSNNGVTGTWSPAVNNTATTTYTFTPNAGQCASTATMTVAVNNNVTPAFTQIAAICPGGSFTLPATSNNGVTGTWSPAVNNNATTTYTFTPNAGQCASTATMTVAVNNNVTPAFTQIAAICPGGSFTLPAVSNNGVTGTWSPAVNNNATTTYTFTPNAGQCASTATMTVAVNNNVTPAFTQIAAFCPGGSFTLPAVSNNGVTGTWSPAVNNNVTTTYTFTPNAGQCASTTTMTVAVNANVTPSFTQIGAICAGGSFTLPAVSNNGVTGTWSPAVNNNATTTYTFTPNAGQCASTATMTVVVNNVNTGVTVTGATITATLSGVSYQWINCADGLPIGGATAVSYTATANGSYAVIITQNGCQATSQCVTITNLANETFTQQNWKVYPNPAEQQLFIETDEAVAIVITDMTGKTVGTQVLASGTNSIDVASLSAGMYFIKSANGACVKFIKR